MVVSQSSSQNAPTFHMNPSLPHQPAAGARPDMVDGRLLAIGRGEKVETYLHPSLAHESPVVNIEHFSLWYGLKQALFDVHLNIPKGKITYLIGPAACGKCTLL